MKLWGLSITKPGTKPVLVLPTEVTKTDAATRCRTGTEKVNIKQTNQKNFH